MHDYKTYLREFMEWCEYPEEAIAVLMENYEKICRHPAASRLFHDRVMLFDNDQLYDYPEAIEQLKNVAEWSGAHYYSAQMLFIICLSRHTKELYEQKNLPMDVYRMSMLDFKWKLFECHNVHHVWGTITGPWFERFFRLTRFALGRLQFETAFAKHTFMKGENVVYPGDLVINMHIPSCGPLTKESFMDAFRQAEKWFSPLFGDKPVAFTCNSWIIYPKQRPFLPERSNLRDFMDAMTIVDYAETSANLWRLFGTPDCSDISRLPRDNSLRRAYITMMESGISPGTGRAYFFMKDGKIL